MNILVLSETFNKGGLETHIDTYYNELKKHNNLVFGFGRYVDNGYLKESTIIDGFSFAYNSTIKDFIRDVKRIVKLINDYNIDIIHVHPFYSLFPAIFAASLTNTKLVYTYHGRGSINFVNYKNDTVLFNFAIENVIKKIFCVNKEGILWFNNYNDEDKAILFPNIINEDIFTKHDVVNNKKWALISRLDQDKEDEILKFLDYLPSLDIAKLDIYGDGSSLDKIRKYVKQKKLQSIVDFKGFVNNISDIIVDYTGVLGVGRVALESLTMNYPTLLIGYGKVCGVIDRKMFNNLKNINFIPVEIDEISKDDLINQIVSINNKNYKEYQLRNEVIKHMGKSHIENYLSVIKDINPVSLKIYDNTYKEIKSIKNKEESFYNSLEIFNILRKNIGSYTNNILLKQHILLIEKNNELNYQNLVLNNEQTEIKDKMNKLEQEMNAEKNNLESFKNSVMKRVDIQENTSFLTLVKRDFKKLKYRMKKK